MVNLTTEQNPACLGNFHYDDFIFLSSNKSLHAKGCFTKITTPAVSNFSQKSSLSEHVSHYFKQAKQQGIANPILVGAIPFDKQQPSALFIPEHYKWINRQNFSGLSDSPRSSVQRLQTNPDKQTFCQMVSSGVGAIHHNSLDKVVLSRLLEIEIKEQTQAISLFMLLNKQNPTSYSFYVPIEQYILIGASPELLLRKQGNIIKTFPLAGSSQRSLNHEEDQRRQKALLNSEKNRHEHQLVINAIEHILRDHCNKLSIPDVPSLVKTPFLWHLGTEIQGELIDKQLDILTLACLLHPTPALCGFPSQPAATLINQLEPFKRGYFGGIVGWCDSQGNGEWVVTIRCGQVSKNHITLFAGAGIVADSNPDAEWHETEVKFGTMLHALGLFDDKESVYVC